MKVTYADNQTPDRIFICIKITSTQLELLRLILPINIFVSDLGKNGYLIDFPYAITTIIILTLINDGPIGKAEIEPITINY